MSLAKTLGQLTGVALAKESRACDQGWLGPTYGCVLQAATTECLLARAAGLVLGLTLFAPHAMLLEAERTHAAIRVSGSHDGGMWRVFGDWYVGKYVADHCLSKEHSIGSQ